MNYSYTRRDDAESLVILTDNGSSRTVPSSHPRFGVILDLLAAGTDEATVLAQVDFGQAAGVALTRLSERVSYVHGSIFFDGDKLDTALSRHIVRMIQTGDQAYPALVKFLDNLAQNPSAKSRRQLWRWLAERDFSITADGQFVGYKGVQNTPDNLSVSRGSNVVTVDGVAHTGHIPNPVGAVVEMARTQVDDDREVGCSQGLHVGTYEYALSFGSKLLICTVNPRDVVSVPSCSDFQKLRTCRYQVSEVRPARLNVTTYSSPLFDDDDDDDRCDDCGEFIEDCECADAESDTDADPGPDDAADRVGKHRAP